MRILFMTDPQSECPLTVDFLTREVYPRGAWAFELAQKVEEQCPRLVDALCTFYFYLRYYETEEAIRMSGPTLYARFTSLDGRELCKRRVAVDPNGTIWVYSTVDLLSDKDRLMGKAAIDSLCIELNKNS